MPEDKTKNFDKFIKHLTATLVNLIKLTINIGLLSEDEELIINCNTGEEITVSYSKPDMTVKEEAGWHLKH